MSFLLYAYAAIAVIVFAGILIVANVASYGRGVTAYTVAMAALAAAVWPISAVWAFIQSRD